MRKSTTTTIIAAGALTALGLAVAPAAMAAIPSDLSPATSVAAMATTDAQRGPAQGDRGHGPRGAEKRGLDTVMTVLDLTEDELKAAREAGTTLAELASQQGVDTTTLIDALVADAEAHLAEHVAEDELTQDEANARLADITERITDHVNGVEPAEGDRPAPGERGGHGPHGHGPQGEADDES